MNVKLHDFIVEKLRETKRENIEELIAYLDTTDFFIAPASTKFHGCYEGGLAEHSVNVYDAINNLDKHLYETYKMPREKEDSLIIVSLLHDLTKVNFYQQKDLWRKDANGKWESYPGYVQFCPLPMGHAAKSVFIAQKFIQLTDEEAQAIFWHMGAYDKSEYNNFNALGDAFSNNGLAYKLHTADMMATYVLENETILWES